MSWESTPGEGIMFDAGGSGGGGGGYIPWAWVDSFEENYEDEFGIPCDQNLQNIPNTITTLDGTVVTIDFGFSKDGVSSDRAVAPQIISALEFALNSLNVASISKINRLFISTTSNGAHNPKSNHYINKAIDISRINGVKMKEMTDLSMVSALQNAFERYWDIRENFGLTLPTRIEALAMV
jgi:hypothetical protein